MENTTNGFCVRKIKGYRLSSSWSGSDNHYAWQVDKGATKSHCENTVNGVWFEGYQDARACGVTSLPHPMKTVPRPFSQWAHNCENEDTLANCSANTWRNNQCEWIPYNEIPGGKCKKKDSIRTGAYDAAPNGYNYMWGTNENNGNSWYGRSDDPGHWQTHKKWFYRH